MSDAKEDYDHSLTFNSRIMPPGTWHEVYTPCHAHASGGHFISYDTMHLMEISRHFDHNNGLAATNSSHASVHTTLCYMMVGMIRMDDRGECPSSDLIQVGLC